MGALDNRDKSDSILKGRFISKVLKDESTSLDRVQRTYMSSRGFNEANGWNDRTFSVTDNVMDYEHLKKHRFVDMRFRQTAEGRRKKKSHPIHNRPIFGHFNNIVRELKFGFIESIKDQIRQIED